MPPPTPSSPTPAPATSRFSFGVGVVGGGGRRRQAAAATTSAPGVLSSDDRISPALPRSSSIVTGCAVDPSSAASVTVRGYSLSSQLAQVSRISDADFEPGLRFVAVAREKFAQHSMIVGMPDDEICRFLAAHKGAVPAALKQLGATLDWRASYDFNSVVDEDFSDLEASGKLQLRGKDKAGNAILVWRHSRHFPESSTLERDIRFIVHTLEQARRAGADRITAIIDRLGMTPANHDTPLIRALLTTFQHHYPDRLARLFVFPKSAVLSMGWKFAKVFIDAATISRIHILGEDEYRACLLQNIDRSDLLERYGGDLVDPADAPSSSPSGGEEGPAVAATRTAAVAGPHRAPHARHHHRPALAREGSDVELSPPRESPGAATLVVDSASELGPPWMARRVCLQVEEP
ncbi:hypothetical protein HK405_008173 [Cladochytrium tenue]|nr:hypothetical protein HK405_008173 [Cladochytrium tenue]